MRTLRMVGHCGLGGCDAWRSATAGDGAELRRALEQVLAGVTLVNAAG